MIDPASPQTRLTDASIAAGAHHSIAPVAQQQRLASLDVLRGVAVLGILLMNIIGFGLPHWAYDDPSVVGGATGLNLAAWITTSMLFEGTMRAMFALLFGAGVVLLTSRLEARAATIPGSLSPADIYFRRNMWLIVFGIIHSYLLLWVGDVLYAYGVVGVFLYVFRQLAPSRLIAASMVILLVITTRNVYERHSDLSLLHASDEAQVLQDAGVSLSDEQRQSIDQWAKVRDERKPDAQELKNEIDDMRGSYVSLFKSLAPVSLWLQTKNMAKYGLWDAACMMLLGMALMKLGVLSGSRSGATYAGMALGGYGIGLAINGWETAVILRNHFSIEAFDTAYLTYDLGRLAMVIGHIGVIMLIWKSGAVRWLMTALAACGQMALTNYLMQTVLCGAIFFGHGLGLFGSLERWELYIVVACVWAVQLIVSPIWLRFFHFGPAEWLWRTLTYWQLQPMWRQRPLIVQRA